MKTSSTSRYPPWFARSAPPQRQLQAVADAYGPMAPLRRARQPRWVQFELAEIDRTDQ